MKFQDLTPEQLSKISNGCGRKGGYIKPPNWIFTASCDHHDFHYWVGGNEYDRWKADFKFYMAMLQDAHDKGNWFTRRWYNTMAWLYYQAVRKFGRVAFSYGRKKTLADVV
jgi:hypothetical protein